MKLSPALLDALQGQYTVERYNAAIYDTLSTSLDVVNWEGSSAWMKRAANEEREHAQRFADYLIDRNETPECRALPAFLPPIGADLIAYFQAALETEQNTTDNINTLYYQAEAAEDPATCQFLHWFLAEQVKSEREIIDIITSISRLGNDGRQVFDQGLK